MEQNFDKSLARVLVYEGGLVRNPHDPGGRTNKGITQAVYNSYRARGGAATQSVAKITDKEVADIYKREYWDRIHGDELPSGVDFCMFDAAVNSGVGGASKWAQGVLGLVRDGDFGPKTLDGIGDADPEDFITEFCSRRLGTLQRLKTWKYFGKGWSARIANVQKTSLAWANEEDAPDAVPVYHLGGHAKSRVSDVPNSRVGSLVTNAGTMGGVVVTGAASLGQQLSPASETFDFLKYVLGFLTVVGAIAGIAVYASKWSNDQAHTGVRKGTVDEDADLTVTAPAAEPEEAVVVKAATTQAPAAEVAHG